MGRNKGFDGRTPWVRTHGGGGGFDLTDLVAGHTAGSAPLIRPPLAGVATLRLPCRQDSPGRPCSRRGRDGARPAIVRPDPSPSRRVAVSSMMTSAPIASARAEGGVEVVYVNQREEPFPVGRSAGSPIRPW